MRFVHQSQVLAMCVVCGTAVAQEERPDSVALAFRWPVGLEASVTHRRVQIREGDGKADTTDAGMTYRMRVSTDPSGLRIGFDSISPTGRGIAAGADAAALSEQLGTLIPDLIVDEGGNLLDVAGIEALVDLVRTMLAPVLDSLPPDKPEARAWLEGLVSREFLASKAAEDWNALVGFWLDAKLERAAVYELQTEEAIPAFPGRTVPYRYQFAYTGRTPCSPTDADSACVVLEMVSFPDEDSVRQLITGFVGAMAPDSVRETLRYARLDIENTIRLVTEPSGLIPHALKTTQSVEAEMAGPGGEAQTFCQERVRTLAFSYLPRGSVR
jgi:hypothetical protein